MEIEKPFEGNPGSFDGSIGLICKKDYLRVLFDPNENDEEGLQELEANFRSRHTHDSNLETQIYIEPLYPIGKTPQRQIVTESAPLKLKSPYEFYPNQILYMQLVKQSIREAKVTLIEAGTGFGKTIANLFASLEENYFPGNIIYLSRTTQQNEQVLIELKNVLRSNPKAEYSAIQLASRKFLCNVPEVLNASNNSQVRLCKHYQYRYKTCCSYSKYLESGGKQLSIPDIATVNDLKEVTKNKCCPYLTSQEIVEDIDVISGSYNYFLDPQIRSTFPEFESKIIIIDESHNIEDLLCNIYSETIRAETLDESMTEIRDYVTHCRKREREDPSIEKEDFTALEQLVFQLKDFKQNLLFVIQESVKTFDTQTKQLILPNNERLKVEFKEYTYFSSQFKKFLYLRYAKVLLVDFKKKITKNIEKLLKYYVEDSKIKQDLQIAVLLNFIDLISFYFDNSKFAYQVTYYTKSKNFQLAFKCLTPEIAFKGLSKVAKSVVLTSGTLTPMNLWLKILNINPTNNLTRVFPSVYNLQNVKVLTLGSFSAGKQLTTKYKYRIATNNEVFQYYRAVILEIITKANIHGGILIFSPSYDIIEKLDLPGSIDDFSSQRVRIHIEKRQTKQELSDSDESEDFKDNSVIEELRDFRLDTAKNIKSVLVGVLGGKFSEGTDFKNNQSRLVIIIGVPYPTLDPLTDIKKIFYNVREKGLGNLWYQAQAVRKVSQALGRVCRNDKDWGLGILLDERYLEKAPSKFDRESQKLLSQWIRQVKEDCTSLSDLTLKMNLFYAKFKGEQKL